MIDRSRAIYSFGNCQQCNKFDELRDACLCYAKLCGPCLWVHQWAEGITDKMPREFRG